MRQLRHGQVIRPDIAVKIPREACKSVTTAPFRHQQEKTKGGKTRQGARRCGHACDGKKRPGKQGEQRGEADDGNGPDPGEFIPFNQKGIADPPQAGARNSRWQRRSRRRTPAPRRMSVHTAGKARKAPQKGMAKRIPATSQKPKPNLRECRRRRRGLCEGAVGSWARRIKYSAPLGKAGLNFVR